jgi:DNA repair protein RadC
LRSKILYFRKVATQNYQVKNIATQFRRYAVYGVAVLLCCVGALVGPEWTKDFSYVIFLHDANLKQTQLRVTYTEKILSAPLCSAGDTYGFLIKIWDKQLLPIQEQVYILCLNNSNQVIGWRCINTGTGTQTLFDLKFALSCALNCLATKMIIAHNHPSGALKPSYDDIRATNKLDEAAGLLDIKLADHIILNKTTFYSFANNLLLKL